MSAPVGHGAALSTALHGAWAELGARLQCGAAPSEIDLTRHAFRLSLAAAVPFSVVAANARLDVAAAEALALLCTVEMGPGHKRLTLGDLAGPPRWRRRVAGRRS